MYQTSERSSFPFLVDTAKVPKVVIVINAGLPDYCALYSGAKNTVEGAIRDPMHIMHQTSMRLSFGHLQGFTGW